MAKVLSLVSIVNPGKVSGLESFSNIETAEAALTQLTNYFQKEGVESLKKIFSQHQIAEMSLSLQSSKDRLTDANGAKAQAEN